MFAAAFMSTLFYGPLVVALGKPNPAVIVAGTPWSGSSNCLNAMMCTPALYIRLCVCVQVEKEVVKAIRQMEEVEVEVKKKKEVSSRVKQLRRQVSVTAFESLEVVTHDK